MAHYASLGRLASTAVISARFGTSQVAKVPIFVTTGLVKNPDDLCCSFRKLNLSPVEARLTSHVLSGTKKNALSTDLFEYQLPSIIKPINITVPSAYGAILEKELPAIPAYTELIDPLVKNEILESPSEKYFPVNTVVLSSYMCEDNAIFLSISDRVVEKQAARLIVIRRKKMKKHKLKKLRKKMKFVWLKIIQRREYQKEKAFQAEQMAIVREGEAFNAVQYVSDVLKQSKTKPPPKYFKDKKLPTFIVEQLRKELKIKQEKRMQHKLAIEEMKEEIKEKGLLQSK